MRPLVDLSLLQPPSSTGRSSDLEILVLDPNGRIEHAAAVLDDGEATWLITETGGAGPLLDYLDSMRFAMRVERSEEHTSEIQSRGHSVYGPLLETKNHVRSLYES